MSEQDLKETFLDGRTVFQGKLIRVEHWDVRLPDGETALREVVCHSGAAAVVPVDEDGCVILVRQHRIAVDRLTLEIPAGKFDHPGEDPLVCAQRELSEETGFVARHWEKLTCLETTPAFCNERIHLYLASGLSSGSTHPDEDEFVATVRMPLSEAVDRVMRGEFRDGKTALALLMAARKLAH